MNIILVLLDNRYLINIVGQTWTTGLNNNPVKFYSKGADVKEERIIPTKAKRIHITQAKALVLLEIN